MDSNQTTEIAVGSVLVVIATAGVILRFVARVVRKSGIGLDDWLSLASLILIFSLLIELLLWATIGGNGLHQDQVTPEEMSNFLKIFYANELSYVLCSPCIKLCILAFYHKLFVTPVFQYSVKAIGLVTVLFSFSCEVAAIVQCSPVAAAWDKALLMQPGAHCFDSQSYFLAFQSLNIFLDILILGLPLPIIWNLHRPWQDKLALTFVFVLGGLLTRLLNSACAASIYRIVTLFYIQTDDVTFTIYRSTVWTLVEPCLGLLCACLPVIRGLLPRWKPKIKRPSYHSFGMSHLRRHRGNTNGGGGGGVGNGGSHNVHAGHGGSSSDLATAGSESYHILDGAQVMAGGKENARCNSSTGSSMMESAKMAKTSDESEAGRRMHTGGIYVTTTITHLPLPKTL